ncbi:V-type ATP synthase subunit I, partial [Intestinibacillus massiliensis]|nr:V-type ATP synthase subunit I [Intestinibacillus massiliensis]
MDCLASKDNLLHTDKVDIITGWVVADKKDKVSRELEKYTCCYEYTEPEKDEDFPVLMKNSKLVAPFGALTEMYSLPNANSMDTNWAIGFFFFLFFGMMLSDAGYGLLLTVGGLGAAKLLDVGEGMKRLLT